MATMASAKEKYARKTANAGPSYDAAKGRMKSNWRAGMARFGVTPGPVRSRNYDAGVDAATYRAGDPNKWETNFLAKMRE